jgi:hypothetical protein
MPPCINVENRSRVVSDLEVRKMVQAANLWLPAVAKAHGVASRLVKFRQPEPGCWRFFVLDEDSQVQDALAFHSEEQGVVTGYVLAKTILDNGGAKLWRDAVTPTVASAFAHELAEALLDPVCNLWASSSDTLMVAFEICDPVQGRVVPVQLPDRTKVGMSDYVLPAWFDPQATRGPFNAANTLQAPFQVEHGGYVVQLDLTTGQVSYVFGQKVPQWLQKQKLATRKCGKRTKACKAKAKPKPEAKPEPTAAALPAQPAHPVPVPVVSLPVASLAPSLAPAPVALTPGPVLETKTQEPEPPPPASQQTPSAVAEPAHEEQAHECVSDPSAVCNDSACSNEGSGPNEAAAVAMPVMPAAVPVAVAPSPAALSVDVLPVPVLAPAPSSVEEVKE